jgi:hypothetical protein
MILIFVFFCSVNYLTGFKWFEYKQIYRISYHAHIIETNLKNLSFESKWEILDIEDWEYKEYYNTRYQHLFICGIFKPLEFKKIQFEPCLNLGCLTDGVEPYLPGRLISFIFSPSFKIKKRIPNTNFIIGLDYSFYLPIVFFKKHLFTDRYFTLFFDIGFVIKD